MVKDLLEENEENKLYIGKIPFYFAPIVSPDNPDNLPNSLDFSFEVRDGVLSQVYSREADEALNKAYKYGGTMPGCMGENIFGKSYADDVLAYIENENITIAGKKVLDIGCGNGYLLKNLNDMGAICFGVEPGESYRYATEEYGLKNIVHDYFSKDLFLEKFDIVILCCVLEHIYDAKDFINSIKAILDKNGEIIVTVPNCTREIEIGDISMLLAEHWSYYTDTSLKGLALRSGLIGEVRTSTNRNLLYGHFRSAENNTRVEDEISDVFPTSFHIKIRKSIKQMEDYFDSAIARNETIGIFVPGRWINYRYLLQMNYDDLGIRFFSDDKTLHKTYYPGINTVVESREELLQNPVDRILVASWTYGNTIAESLYAEYPFKDIKTLENILINEKD